MFPLLRYFSIASLISVIVTTVVLGALHSRVEREQLLAIGESNHVALAQSFANALMPQVHQLAQAAARRDRQAVPALPEFAVLRLGAREATRNTRVIRLKVYGVDGRTLFSTEAAQVGSDEADNPGFRSALRGKPLSELTHRERFTAFDGEWVDRDVLSSYVALQSGEGKPIEGVLEIYSDVTEWIAHTERQARLVTLSVVLALCLLYAVLYVIVRRADRILREQYARQKSAEEEIRYLAFFDPLTGLPNRRLLQDRLQQAIAGSTRSRRWGALLFVDLDRFKEINDTFGHAQGDHLLQQVAARLSANVREIDTVARWGGDEFVVVLQDLADSRELALTHATAVARKLHGLFEQPFLLADEERRITPSVGVTVFQGQQVSLAELLKQADAAMYAAKAAGRNTVEVFAAGTEPPAGPAAPATVADA